MIPFTIAVLGGTMRTRSIAAAAIVLSFALAGCGSSADDKPAPTVTATKTVDPEAARQKCVDAWADLIQQDSTVGVDDEPSECAGLPADDQLDRYMEGLSERNRRARKALGG